MPVFFSFLIDAVSQSWGDYSPSTSRATLTYPTRSGVAGLLANALGIDRIEVETLNGIHRNIRVSSRVLKKGTILRDFHNKRYSPTDGDPWDMHRRTKDPVSTAHNQRNGLMTPDQHSSQLCRKTTERFYLNDWAFDVVVEVMPRCPFTAEQFLKALHNPARGIYFGRKTCIPLRPLVEEKAMPVEAASPLEVFSIPIAPLYMEEGKNYKFADPAKALIAHLDVEQASQIPGCTVVPEMISDACFSVNGRIFHPRKVFHVTRLVKE